MQLTALERKPIILDLPVPPSVNKLRRLNKAALRAYERWKQVADAIVTAHWAAMKFRGTGRPTLAGERVVVSIYISERARLDADNAHKALMDYLTRIEVISDDRKRFVRRIITEWVPPDQAPQGVRIVVAPYYL